VAGNHNIPSICERCDRVFGRAQALHVAIEGKRRDIFDLLVETGADVSGTNDEYDHCCLPARCAAALDPMIALRHQ
jgi:hypothetical protein